MKKQKHPLLTVTATLSATLILGMILGGAIVGAIIRDRLETLRDVRTADGFTQYVSQQIGPVPADRQARFNEILSGTGAQVEQLLKEGRSDFMQIIDSMEQELAPVISKEQLERWQAERKKVRDRIDGT